MWDCVGCGVDDSMTVANAEEVLSVLSHQNKGQQLHLIVPSTQPDDT